MPDWSIKITPNPVAVAGQPGVFAPQQANAGDNVSWNNATKDQHQPWPTDKNYNPLTITPTSPKYLSDVIEPGTSSDAFSLSMPADVDPKTGIGTLYYCCALHKAEHGTILVKDVPPVPPAPPPQN